jgi:hypothetical protein
MELDFCYPIVLMALCLMVLNKQRDNGESFDNGRQRALHCGMVGAWHEILTLLQVTEDLQENPSSFCWSQRSPTQLRCNMFGRQQKIKLCERLLCV